LGQGTEDDLSGLYEASAPGLEVGTLVRDRNQNQSGTDPFY